jgi:hypothetical protein
MLLQECIDVCRGANVTFTYEGYLESKEKCPEYICNAFFYSLVALLQHLYLLFSIVTMDHNDLSKPGNNFFFIPAS